MKVAVIGARGFVGKHLCNALMDKGYEVSCYSVGDAQGISPETGLMPGNFSFPSGLDAVYYLAQSPRYRQMPEQSSHLFSVNCLAAVQAADAARRVGVKRFVYASTGNVYAPSFSPLSESSPVRRDNWYALSKLMAEDALALYRPYFDVAVARIFGVYGPGQDEKLVPIITQAVRAGRGLFVDRNPVDSTDLDGLKVSLIYISDVVDALISLIGNTHQGSVNFAGSEPISIRKLAISAGNILGVAPKIAVGSANREFDLAADISLYQTLFGVPRVSFENGLRRTLLGR